MQKQPIFIVGTGRCGSTLLSNILNKNEDLLSLSEFFVSLHPAAFQNQVLDGSEFWEVLSRPNPVANILLQNNLGTPEILYSSKKLLPPIQLITLPHLTKDVELIYKKMEEYITTRTNRKTLSDYYLELFDWMSRYFNRKMWIERSGMSLQYVHILMELFPGSKFIHLYRDGRECAMSMSRHHVFRLRLIQMMVEERIKIDPYSNYIYEEQLIELKELAELVPQQFNVHAYHNYHIPVEQFGKMWSNLILNGVRHLNKIPPENLLNLKYEDILEEPRKEIRRVMSFINDEFDDDQVIEKSVELVQTDKPLTWINLSEDEKNRLSNECAVGMRLLRNNTNKATRV